MSIDVNKVVWERTYDIHRVKDLSFLETCDPAIRDFYGLWDNARNEEGIVLKSSFLPEDMGALLSSVFIIDREPENGDYRYKLVGSNEILFRKTNPTGKLVKDGHVGTISDALTNYDYVFQEKSHLFMLCNIYKSEQYVVTDETLFLPVSNDGDVIDYCYGLGVQKLGGQNSDDISVSKRLIFDINL
ncbi:PAS domain-containing protein [Curvivirga aplysinae]|uniref:hypothetical protein n=1 Tax=Curvivirga aplysinae TaxID=2529852 RepID=UPI0012BB6DDF|nr:hypothetical protein [Curvivirga aplysinae]MTI08990.1 hypothetical protein [Curvivirga aplysinae]